MENEIWIRIIMTYITVYSLRTGLYIAACIVRVKLIMLIGLAYSFLPKQWYIMEHIDQLNTPKSAKTHL